MSDTIHFLFGSGGSAVTSWQMCVRGLLLFIYGLVLLRLGARRMLVRMSAFDVMTMIVIGSNLSRAITGNAPLVPVMTATATLVLLHYLLASLSFFSPLIERLVEGSVHQLSEAGQIHWEVMRKSKITEEDLREGLRLKGVADPNKVVAYLERNGAISAVAASK